MSRNEKQTRIELIDPALNRAGWKVLNKKFLIEKNKACIEIPVTGMPKTFENPSGNGFVDYVLFGDDGKPLAIVEAKKSVANEEQGRVQACLYADALEKQYGVRPVIYYTNGYNIRIIDGLYPPRTVFGFHKKDELEYLIQRRKFELKDKTVNADICGRYYQKDAIEEVIKHLGTKHSRSLIVLATGTGKTRVSCGISDIFIRNNLVKRILFLADRKNLVKQAKEETFEKFLSTVPMSIIVEGYRETEENQARIVFSTYQSMLSIIKDTSKCPYGIGHFDLIIVDEAHRSLFNKYAEIFEYFDALMIGLTATPRNDIHKSTYKVFNLDNDEPNYEYDVVKGVKDGYLTYYRALDRTPDILKNGLTYDELSSEEKEQYEDLFAEEDGTLPEKIEGKEFYSVITNKDTIRTVLENLMQEGIKVNNGDTLGKTIIFAKDHNHAVLIQKTFIEMYPELSIPGNPNGVDYCVVIDNQIKYNEVLQREFKEKQSIRIVVSVDMMDTGVDIPEVVNLVFFKKVLSKIKFWQMIGRGTRICDDNKPISPSKAYFERMTNDSNRQLYQNKQGFLIFDICNVFPFFKEHPEGKEDKTDAVLSLYQKIYMEKVALYKAMQSKYGNLTIEDKKFYEALRDELINEVKNLNRNFIGVKANLEIVEKYSKIENWLRIDQPAFVEIKKKIAPNIIGEIDIESARAFDYLCYKFAATKFYVGKDFAKTAKTIYDLSSYLSNHKLHVSEVLEHEAAINYVMSAEFLNNATVCKVDEIRKELRDLMRYIEKAAFTPIISDFDDQISSYNDAIEEDIDFHISIDDFKTFEDKIKFYIQENPNNNLVYSIANLKKPNEEYIKEFKFKAGEIAKTPEELYDLFPDDESIVKFIRSNIEFNPNSVNEFIEKFDEKGFNNIQLAYIKEVLLFISENGEFNLKDLLKPELSFKEIMNSEEIKLLLDELKQVI